MAARVARLRHLRERHACAKRCGCRRARRCRRPSGESTDRAAAPDSAARNAARSRCRARARRRGARRPVAAGEQLVKSNIAEFGSASLQTAEAYTGLADAHRQTKDYEKAAENYLAAVEIYRAVDGPFTPLAIGPLTSLGDNYHEADDDVNAVTSYTEARTVSRRVYGLHNEDQIELLDRMSRSLLDSESAPRSRGTAGRSAAPRAARNPAGLRRRARRHL